MPATTPTGPASPTGPAPTRSATPTGSAATSSAVRTTSSGPASVRPAPVALAAVLDAACVLGFAAAGRSTHAEDGGIAGVLGTAWPFGVACAVGWLLTRGWRRPARVWPTGVMVWAATWVLGLTLRGLAGDGLAPAFVAVAGIVLAVALLGWRGLATAVSSVRRRRAGVPARRR